MYCATYRLPHCCIVILAKAGIQNASIVPPLKRSANSGMDSRFRGNDGAYANALAWWAMWSAMKVAMK